MPRCQSFRTSPLGYIRLTSRNLGSALFASKVTKIGVYLGKKLSILRLRGTSRVARRKRNGSITNPRCVIFPPPYRMAHLIHYNRVWWFASFVFPLVASALGPIACLLAICALVHSWLTSRPSGVGVINPGWYVRALQASSMSNVCQDTRARDRVSGVRLVGKFATLVQLCQTNFI